MTTDDLKHRGWKRQELGGAGGEGWTHPDDPGAQAGTVSPKEGGSE